MKTLTSALALMAALTAPAYAGGLVATPMERPALPANICQHIPWTECGMTRGDGPQAADTSPGTPATPVSPAAPATPVSPPVKELPTPKPCHGGTKGEC